MTSPDVLRLSELRVGDLAYVINGQQNNIFDARVIEVDNTGVAVTVGEKNEVQWYWHATGTADVEVGPSDDKILAHLVTSDDWRVPVLLGRRRFKALHRDVIEATTAFRKDPSRENSARLVESTIAWSDFAKHANQAALRAETIFDYVTATTQ